MLNRIFGTTPEKLYNKLYDHIQKNYGKDNFSPSGYALEGICKYLVDHPQDCSKLKGIIDAKCAANTGDKVAAKMASAFKDLLNPKYRDEMAKEGKLGNDEKRDQLIRELDQINKTANNRNVKQEAPAAATPDTRPYSVMLVGDTRTGKHAIASSFIDGRFPDPDEPQGVRIRDKSIMIDDANMNLSIEVKGGQDAFRYVHAAYYRGYDGVVFVFDVTDKQSFDDLNNWINEINRYCDEHIKKIIVANKIDQPGRVIDHATAKEFADSLNINYVECSAITNQNIAEIFTVLGRDMREHRRAKQAQAQPPQAPIGLLNNSNIGYRK